MERDYIQQLFKQHYAKMYRVAYSILLDEQESKDVVSDVFAGLLQGNTMLLPDTCEHYLLTSVRNQCFKRIRHEETKQRAEQFICSELQTTISTEDERLIDINEYVASCLSPQDRRIFRMRYYYGSSYDEIAISEGISRVAVWKHLSRVLNSIKKHFREVHKLERDNNVRG
ncbi:MAG: sigma-70 family RNA polymerase sigma factor [Bacteroidaceae bacterium]|nr:sigma-70 family RNA polymerase sigma factor [Bacteroidaceae bacterium]